MAGFEELGLRDELVDRAREHGFDAPSSLQRSIIPVLRRGGNAIVRASSGSGITAAYALALIDQFNEGEGTRALVITPTDDRAERVASTIARFAHGTNVRVAALTNTWSYVNGVTILVASAERLLNGLEDSRIKLDGLQSVVLDNAASTIQLAGEKSLETIFSSLPREGQRIFISSEMTDAVRKLADSYARKALTFPPKPAVEAYAEATAPTMTLRYAVVSADKKTDLIARLAQKSSGPLTLLCRGTASATEAERALSSRGFEVNAATYDGFDRDEVKGSLFAYDAPFSAEQLTECFTNGAVILCERHELPHLKTIAADANVKLEAAKLPPAEADSLNDFRNEIRKAARDEDLQAHMLVLEPLFSEFSPEEVAAAAAALLRARRPAKSESAARAEKAGVRTFARLFMSVGERDGIRAGDLVGAITGESGINGEDVGRVDIRDTFSVVEIAAGSADRVIQSLNGTTMKNRSLRVDYDRKTAGGAARSGPHAPKRREGGRPPQRRER